MLVANGKSVHDGVGGQAAFIETPSRLSTRSISRKTRTEKSSYFEDVLKFLQSSNAGRFLGRHGLVAPM